jgi:hypothetical protein
LPDPDSFVGVLIDVNIAATDILRSRCVDEVVDHLLRLKNPAALPVPYNLHIVLRRSGAAWQT